MITFTVWKTGHHQYRGFSCSGHAGYAESGEDIICAAVSALVLNTFNSIEQFTDDALEAEQAEEDGRIIVRFPEPLSKRAVLLMDSLILGIESIEAEYGNEYITLISEEV